MSEKYYVGFDAGSTYVKSALIKNNEVVATGVMATGIDNVKTSELLLESLIEQASITREDIAYINATGYSRRSLDLADDTISEITAHAYGIRLTAPKEASNIGLIIDIGGQDSKIICLDENYQVKNFTMNDKCAAGTGKFIEVIAQILETTIDKVGELSLCSTAPCPINSLCVVFAQTEVVSLVAQKKDRNDILAGMHISMAKRVSKMARKYKTKGSIVMTGGGALNEGLRVSFEDELMTDVYRACHPQFNGAIGAAIIGQLQYNKEL